jgi:hypothetical protein
MSDNGRPQADSNPDGDITHPDLRLAPLTPPVAPTPEQAACIAAEVAAGITVKIQDGSDPCNPNVKSGKGIPDETP